MLSERKAKFQLTVKIAMIFLAKYVTLEQPVFLRGFFLYQGCIFSSSKFLFNDNAILLQSVSAHCAAKLECPLLSC